MTWTIPTHIGGTVFVDLGDVYLINYISTLFLPKLMSRSKQFQIDYRYRIDKQIIRQIDKYRIDIRQIERIDIPIDILDRNIKQLEEEIEERFRIVYMTGKLNFEL